MRAIPTYKTAFTDLCFKEQGVEFGEHFWVGFEVGNAGGCRGEGGETELEGGC